jgi:predicted RNase H-like HicB family nuclease
MFSQYLQKAMHQAIYEKIEDGSCYGEIPEFQGVYANADNLKSCQETLQEVLEGWIILGLRLQHPLPIIDGINLNPQLEVA